MIRSCIKLQLVLIIILNSIFLGMKRMKKKQQLQALQSNKAFLKFEVCKQEMLQSRALLSENTLQKMLNNGLERSCPLNVEAFEDFRSNGAFILVSRL